jgi:aspartate racemase
MINRIAEYIVERYPSAINVGVLSTTGTLVSNVYHDALSLLNLNAIQVSKKIQDVYIQTAIYQKKFGLKSAHPVMSIVKKHLRFGLEYLLKKNVDVIVLGCTELSLVLTKDSILNVPIIDSTRILARSLILASSPQDLLES